MANINRRKILKGISASAAAAITPFSLQAAKPHYAHQHIAIYINANHGHFKNSTSNEIINTSNRPIILNTQQPIIYKETNGKRVTLYVNSSDQQYTLQPGERLPYYAKATLTDSPQNLSAQSKLSGNSITIV